MVDAVSTAAASPTASPPRRRWLTRRRVVAAALLFVLLTPVGIRWYKLWRMPDVPAPFDVEAFAEFPYPEDENAFFHFRLAAAQHQNSRRDFFGLDRFFERGESVTWSDLTDDIQTWVDQEQFALGLFREGGRSPAARSMLPGTTAVNNQYATLLRSIHDLHKLATFDALRLMDAGKTQEAAEVLHDAFRASRLLGQRGPRLERGVAKSCHAILMPGWHQWTRHPNVTAEELESALSRLRNDWKLTPPYSEGLKFDYLDNIDELTRSSDSLKFSFDRSFGKFVEGHRQAWFKNVIPHLDKAVPAWRAPILWTMGEPELTRRAYHLWLSHELPSCDLPNAQLPSTISGRQQLFSQPERTAGLTPGELQQRLDTSQFSEMMPPLKGGLFAQWEEAARQTLLEIEFEWQIRWRRSKVSSQADAERLLSDFAWPIDPCSPDGKPIQHRITAAGLVIWSLGPNGTDQGGNFEDVGFPEDSIVLIPWPDEP